MLKAGGGGWGERRWQGCRRASPDGLTQITEEVQVPLMMTVSTEGGAVSRGKVTCYGFMQSEAPEGHQNLEMLCRLWA